MTLRRKAVWFENGKMEYAVKASDYEAAELIIGKLTSALARILSTANEPRQHGNEEVQMANIATIAADSLNPPWPTQAETEAKHE